MGLLTYIPRMSEPLINLIFVIKMIKKNTMNIFSDVVAYCL